MDGVFGTRKVETHALWVANPPNGRILPGPPQDWPHLLDWEDTFDDEPDVECPTRPMSFAFPLSLTM